VATVKELREAATDWFSIEPTAVEVFIRSLRESGLVPDGGEGGRGKSAPIDAEHAVALLLAMLGGTPAARAGETATRLGSFPLRREGEPAQTAPDEWHLRFRQPTVALTAMEALCLSVNQLRAANSPSGNFVRIEFRSDLGREELILQSGPNSPDQRNVWAGFLFFSESPIAALSMADLVDAPLSDVRSIGGGILLKIARLLGPLPENAFGRRAFEHRPSTGLGLDQGDQQ
jgi:hypothetical protein